MGEKIFTLVNKFRFEIFLITLSLTIFCLSVILYYKNNDPSPNAVLAVSTEKRVDSPRSIFVDINGSVNKPGVYKLEFGARIKDVITSAGGLATTADRGFVARNFNLSRLLVDQDKIYVPSIDDILGGQIIQTLHTVDLLRPQIQSTDASYSSYSEASNTKINLNTSLLAEIDQLPGVGEVLGQKIIDNRPYAEIDDLITKKVLGSSAVEKIKNLISF